MTQTNPLKDELSKAELRKDKLRRDKLLNDLIGKRQRQVDKYNEEEYIR